MLCTGSRKRSTTNAERNRRMQAHSSSTPSSSTSAYGRMVISIITSVFTRLYTGRTPLIYCRMNSRDDLRNEQQGSASKNSHRASSLKSQRRQQLYLRRP